MAKDSKKKMSFYKKKERSWLKIKAKSARSNDNRIALIFKLEISTSKT